MQNLLTLSAEQTYISPEGSQPVVISIGPGQIVETAFRQSPPHASQLEAAINLVEDAIMATGLRTLARGALVADAQILHQALQVSQFPASFSLAQIEKRYQDIAQAAQRLPALSISEPAPLALASLILVRECMHHLGYAEIVLV